MTHQITYFAGVQPSWKYRSPEVPIKMNVCHCIYSWVFFSLWKRSANTSISNVLLLPSKCALERNIFISYVFLACLCFCMWILTEHLAYAKFSFLIQTVSFHLYARTYCALVYFPCLYPVNCNNTSRRIFFWQCKHILKSYDKHLWGYFYTL